MDTTSPPGAAPGCEWVPPTAGVSATDTTSTPLENLRAVLGRASARAVDAPGVLTPTQPAHDFEKVREDLHNQYVRGIVRASGLSACIAPSDPDEGIAQFLQLCVCDLAIPPRNITVRLLSDYLQIPHATVGRSPCWALFQQWRSEQTKLRARQLTTEMLAVLSDTSVYDPAEEAELRELAAYTDEEARAYLDEQNRRKT